MPSLYDRAEIYDLLENERRYEIAKRNWEVLLAGKNVRTLLDVSIGSGSVTLPLLDLGVRLSGSDLSEAMLERCRRKAAERGCEIDLRVSDFRELEQNFSGRFDCVASTGNSLPYVENDQVLGVLEQMDALVSPGGWLCFDLRNWDKILRTRQRFYTYPPFFRDDIRINLVQAWDYCPDGSMDFNLLYTFERDNRAAGGVPGALPPDFPKAFAGQAVRDGLPEGGVVPEPGPGRGLYRGYGLVLRDRPKAGVRNRRDIKTGPDSSLSGPVGDFTFLFYAGAVPPRRRSCAAGPRTGRPGGQTDSRTRTGAGPAGQSPVPPAGPGP